jgi:hypothetical protein
MSYEAPPSGLLGFDVNGPMKIFIILAKEGNLSFLVFTEAAISLLFLYWNYIELDEPRLSLDRRVLFYYISAIIKEIV